MCGLAGFIDAGAATDAREMESQVRGMVETLVHRGPDDQGVWVDAATGFAVGLRRLAVLDLTPAGHQPMLSNDEQLVLAFNGEIYNHRSLRTELEQNGISFRGTSDTEVMLAAISTWGLEQAIERFIGMFAFALWDRRTRTLHLVRDRIGVKPLYWGRHGKHLLFGSELKALRAHPGFLPEIDSDALAAYFRFAYVPTPYSIYKGVRKLTPGTIVSIDSQGQETVRSYWSMAATVTAGLTDPLEISEAEATEELDKLLRDAVECRMIADVPLGAFLSGGIDSSAVTAVMQSLGSQPVKTFSIGFEEDSINEAACAKAVAGHLNTDHTELYVTPDEARSVIPDLATWYDEPFADSSQIPTALVSRLARRDVTVALTGDGGDEFFGGYDRYPQGRALWSRIGAIPAPLRPLMAGLMRAIPIAAWNGLFSLTPNRMTPGQRGRTMHWLAGNMVSRDFDAFFRRLVSIWDAPEALVTGSQEATSPVWDGAAPGDVVERMMYLDGVSYLPDDIMAKVDRATMAFSLEARQPLLDHRICEFAWRLPMDWKLRGGEGKRILKNVLNRYVPSELTQRPKQGFSVPLRAWLRGPLREWAKDLTAADRLERAGILDSGSVQREWKRLDAGAAGADARLWAVVMFESWRERWQI